MIIEKERNKKKNIVRTVVSQTTRYISGVFSTIRNSRAKLKSSLGKVSSISEPNLYVTECNLSPKPVGILFVG